jgi:hypothetical protein
MMKIGFTGTRKGMTDYQKSAVADLLHHFKTTTANPIYAYHGCAVGADRQFNDLLKAENFKSLRIEGYPGDQSQYWWGRKNCDLVYTPKQYHYRNKIIARICDVLIACPETVEELHSGTWSTVWYARRKSKTICIVYPQPKELPLCPFPLAPKP